MWAECLLHGFFPFHLVRCIGVSHTAAQTKVMSALAGASHHPAVQVRREWYF